MNYQHVQLQISDRIAWLRFNRPDQLNAMNRSMMNEIIQALEFVDQASSKQVGVCVITGLGKAFMAGADIKEYAQQTPGEFVDFQSQGQRIYSSIESNSKPVIAAVNGYAFGGGFEIALACDIILARQYAKLGLPEINLALIPGGGGTQRLTKKLGINLANELIMTGRNITAEDLERHGVINHIYAKEVFEEEVEQFARSLAEKPADRLAAIKQLILQAGGPVQDELLSKEQAALRAFYLSAEGQARVQAFYQNSLDKKS